VDECEPLLRGTMAAPPRVFGETLAHEHIRGGAFVGPDGRPMESAGRGLHSSTSQLNLSRF
jgi:hypothetical protein